MKKDYITTEIIVDDNKVRILKIGKVNYISLTDLALHADAEDPSEVIRNWMSNKDSFAFYSLWEELNNPNFNSVESHGIKTNEVPYNRFTMTPSRWKKKFNAIGIIPSTGKYSIGTYAHPDIAFEFASWLSPEFKLYLITEFERLKRKEATENMLDWSVSRILTKINYAIHTDAVKKYIIPILTDEQKRYVYADEADVLNVALFGMTAHEWEKKNPELAVYGNMRDYADLLHLIILNNLENTNAELIKMGLKQSDRLVRLNNSARNQFEILKQNNSFNNLFKLDDQSNDVLLK